MKNILSFNEKHAPKVDEINFSRLMRTNLQYEPLVDLNSSMPKTKSNTLLTINSIYGPKRNDFTKSAILHILLISVYLISFFLSKSTILSPEVVEVDFGLTDTLTQTQAQIPVPINTPEGETEATRAKDALPQLTKNVTPEVSKFPFVPPQPQTITPPKPSEKTQKVDLEMERKKAEKLQKEKLEELERKKILQQEEDEKKQKIKIKDYLKRKEMELRKEDMHKHEGVHNKDEKKPLGQKTNVNKIPSSPFTSKNNIPDSPFSEVPTGNITGKISKSAFNNYQSYLARQLKLNWNASEGANFPVHIKMKVQFKVNAYGYLVGEIKTIETSGNANFDQNVIAALKRTFPVSVPPPKELHPPQTFQAIYSSSGGVQ